MIIARNYNYLIKGKNQRCYWGKYSNIIDPKMILRNWGRKSTCLCWAMFSRRSGTHASYLLHITEEGGDAAQCD